jgi:hypothetical protein
MAAGTLTFVIGNSDSGPQQSIPLDVITSLSEQLDSDVTQYPVERGAQPSDHIQPKAVQLSLDALVADYVIGGTSQPGKARSAMQQLINCRDTGTLLAQTSCKRTYSSLAMTSLKLEPKLGFAAGNPRPSVITLRFTASLQQVRVVETRTVALVKKKTVTKGKKKDDEGNQPTTPTDSNETTYYKISHHGLGSLFSLGGGQ